MFNKSHTKEMEKIAWKIISDPKAKEEKWQAACKIVEGKTYNLSSIPKPIGLILSLIVSIVGSIGGSFLFFLLLGACLLMTVSYYNDPFYIAMAISAPATFLYFFTSIFTYQKHKWKGGKSWDIIARIPLYLMLLPLVIILWSSLVSIEPLGFLLALTMILAMVSSCILSKNITEKSIKNLTNSIGSARVLEYTKYGLCAAILLPWIGRFFVSGPESATFTYLTLAGLLMGTTSYLAVRDLKVTSKKASNEISTFVWSPSLMTALAFLPIVVIGAILNGALTDLSQIGSVLSSFAGGISTIVFILLLPRLGAAIAHRQTRNVLTKELRSVPFGLDKPEESGQNDQHSLSGTSMPKGKTA